MHTADAPALQPPNMLWHRYRPLLAGLDLPAAVVDLEALEWNWRRLLGLAHARAPHVRLASKSVRVPALMEHLLGLAGKRGRGLMSFSPQETRYLVAQAGFRDVLCAYPLAHSGDADAIAEASATSDEVRIMADHPQQLVILSEAAQRHGVQVRVCIDLDASWRPLETLAPASAGAAHIGVRRSPIRDARAASDLARVAQQLPGLVVDSLMAYEAQVAGMPDGVPGDLLRPIRRLIKWRSRRDVATRRHAVGSGLRGLGIALALVNGGGTGSVESTSGDGSCTEVTLGSGCYAPHLFDHYRGLSLRPAIFFALRITRKPAPDIYTCSGGGYVASGPPGSDRLPQVFAPRGLTALPLEGFGEVQTPLLAGPDAPPLKLGDLVLCRPAKAGEFLERFREVHLVRGGEVERRVPTYRGLGECYF